MECSRIGELAGTTAGLPTDATDGRARGHAKPMALIGVLIAQPLQPLTLVTTHLVPIVEGVNDVHTRFEFGHHGYLPTLTDFFFGRLVNATQVPRDNRRLPMQAVMAIVKAGFEQITLWYMGRSSPTDQRYQQHRRFIRAQPQPQGVFLVADKEPRMSGPE